MANFHSNAFDEATLLKLHIYRSYLSSWLPVFIQRPDLVRNGRINVFDFFCGPGEDRDGNPGSPLIALQTCQEYEASLSEQKAEVHLLFNDTSKKKISALKGLIDTRDISQKLRVLYRANSFYDVFHEFLPLMLAGPNLLFIDQCGIKEISRNIFEQLIKLPKTDFIFFISSSFFRRFVDTPEFQKHIDATGYIDPDSRFSDSHRTIASMYKDWIPKEKEYYLAPFSIRKGSNIYGLIFGSSNLLGIWKFLRVLWSIDKERGEANFDIDEDNLPKQFDTLQLFKSNDKSSKLESFQSEIEDKLLAGSFRTDRELAIYCLTNGFLPVDHAKPVMKKLIEADKIEVEDRLRLSEACLKTPRKITLH